MLRRHDSIISYIFNKNSFFLALVLGFFFTFIAQSKVLATTTTWIGATNGDWNTGTNWDTGLVPTANDDVIVWPNTTQLVRAPFNGASLGQGINFRTLMVSSSFLVLYGDGIQNGRDLMINRSGFVVLRTLREQVLTGNLTVSGTLETDTNSGPLFSLDFKANNIYVSGPSSGVVAFGSGYASNGATVAGSGAGAGLGSMSAGGGGAGHYGVGGDGAGSPGSGGGAYCNLNNPITFGSSGGGGTTGDGGFGGGNIILRSVNTTTFDPGVSLVAAGSIGTGWSGGGSGGSIVLVAHNLMLLNQAYLYGGEGGPSGGGSGSGGCAFFQYVNSSSITSSSFVLDPGNPGPGAATGTPGNFLLQQLTTLVNPPTTPTSTSNVTSNTIRFNWTGGNGLETYYTLDRSLDGITYSFFATSSISPTSSPTGTFFYDFGGLNTNQRYWFRVAAGNDVDPTSTYVSSSPLYTLAQTLGAPSISAVGTTTLQLAFDTLGNPSTTLYALYSTTALTYFTASGTSNGSTPIFFPSSSWSGQVVGLTPSTSYRFAVVARNGDGINSATSTVSAATTTIPAIVPNIPVLFVSTQSATTLQLTINTNSNSSSTLYALFNTTTASFIDASGFPSMTPVFFSSSTWNNGNAQGLATDTQYRFVAVAKSTDNIYATSSLTSVGSIAYTRPATPSLVFTSVGTSTIGFIINVNGNSTSTLYSLFSFVGSNYLTPSGTVTTSPQYFSTTSWQNGIQGLTPNTLYSINLRAESLKSSLLDNNTTNNYSTTTLATPVPNVPGVPRSGVITSSSIQLLFPAATTNGNGPTTTYAIYNLIDHTYLDAAGLVTSTPVFQVSSSWSGITAVNLAPLTFYYYEVVANNTLDSRTSTFNSLLTAPAPIPTPVAANITASSAQIQINAGPNSVGTSDLYLKIFNLTDNRYVTVSGAPTTSAVFFTTTTWNNGTVTGLTSNTSYQFGVLPMNGNFLTAPTSTVAFTTLMSTTTPTSSGAGAMGGGGGGGGGAVYYFGPTPTVAVSSSAAYSSSTFVSTSTVSPSASYTSSSVPGLISTFGPGFIFPFGGAVSENGPLKNYLPSIQLFITTSVLKLGVPFNFRYTVTNTSTITRTIRVERTLINAKGVVISRTSVLIKQKAGQVFSSTPRVTLPRTIGIYTVRIRVLTTTGKVIASDSFLVTVRK